MRAILYIGDTSFYDLMILNFIEIIEKLNNFFVDLIDLLFINEINEFL